MQKISQNTLMIKLFRGPRGEDYRRLWDGDNVTNCFDYREAHFVLLSRIAYFVGDDPDRIEKTFNQSALAKDRDWASATHRRTTIREAIRGLDDTYAVAADLIDLSDIQGDGRIAVWARRKLGGEPLPSYKVCWKLARYLRSTPDVDEDEAIDEFCEAVGIDPEEFAAEYAQVAPKVLCPEGQGPWERAVAQAELHPYPINGRPGYRKFVSICYWLQRANDGESWTLNRRGLIELLGVSEMTITRYKDAMLAAGLAVCTCEEYSYSKGQSQEFEWIGPEVEVEVPQCV